MEKGMNNDVLERFMKINRLFHQYHQQSHMHDGPFGDLRRGQGRVLAILEMKPVITQKELSYLLEMKPQSLGELLSKLEKKEFVTRQPSEQDRRVMEIRLTKTGKEALKQRQEKKETVDFDISEALSEDEKRQLETLLDKVIGHLEEKFGKVESNPDSLFAHHHGHGMRSREHGGFLRGHGRRDGIKSHFGHYDGETTEPHCEEDGCEKECDGSEARGE